MENTISPKYLMKLIPDIEDALLNTFKTYEKVRVYLEKWQEVINDSGEGFRIFEDYSRNLDIAITLHRMDKETLLKIAIELGVDTPDFIPSIPIFRNEIKAEYTSASSTFQSAFKKIESEPNIAIGLANSALESIIKEILKDERISSKIKANKTLYDLTSEILKVFQLFPNSGMPEEIKPIGSSLLNISRQIEKLRSDKTDFHGKTSNDYKIGDPIYAYFVVNCVTTVGLFLNSYFKMKFPKPIVEKEATVADL